MSQRYPIGRTAGERGEERNLICLCIRRVHSSVTQNRVSVYVPVVTDAMCILCHVCECFIHHTSEFCSRQDRVDLQRLRDRPGTVGADGVAPQVQVVQDPIENA